MGNGMPVSAVAAREELVSIFRDNTRYFNTFASSPLQAAAGLAVLDVIESESLLSNAADVGNYLKSEVKKLQEKIQPMGDVRGSGLFVGVDWVSDRDKKTPDPKGAFQIANRMKEKGFLLSNAGQFGNVIKIRPPLVFKREHAELFLTAFEEVLTTQDGAHG
jgi:4-aminobutyrate aminotransferase-like enzyme